MPNVVRFALSTARTLHVPGAGVFVDGILDVDANNLAVLTRTRYLVQPYRAKELGIVDSATPKPTLPAVPGPPSPDPYPQYLTAAEAAASPELRAALVPRPAGGTEGQALVKSGSEVVWGSGGVPTTKVGQSASSLPSDWTMVLSRASFLDTPAMGTLKALGAPPAALEIEWQGASPVIQEDGTLICGALAPAVGASGTLLATSATAAVGTWAAPTNAIGAADTNRAVFTSAVANEVGALDVGFDFSSVPVNAPVISVAVTVNGFASADGVMPYTVELVNSSGTHIGSAAQAANNQGARTFTGITYADIAAGMRARVRVVHANNTTSASVSVDAVSVVVSYSAPQYRSEVIFTSDRTDGANDYTVMRYSAGTRIRTAFDVMTKGLKVQDSGAWNVLFQGIGKAQSGAWPGPPLTLVAENGTFRVAGGAAVTYGEPPARWAHEDERWYRWEFDILLGGPGVGKVNAWLDGVQVVTDWFPPSGTFYAGNGNTAIDLDWVYFKNGLYGAATTGPNVPKALFRNRRFSATVGGTTTTWRGPHTAAPGFKIYARNPATDMPY